MIILHTFLHSVKKSLYLLSEMNMTGFVCPHFEVEKKCVLVEIDINLQLISQYNLKKYI